MVLDYIPEDEYDQLKQRMQQPTTSRREQPEQQRQANPWQMVQRQYNSPPPYTGGMYGDEPPVLAPDPFGNGGPPAPPYMPPAPPPGPTIPASDFFGSTNPIPNVPMPPAPYTGGIYGDEPPMPPDENLPEKIGRAVGAGISEMLKPREEPGLPPPLPSHVPTGAVPMPPIIPDVPPMAIAHQPTPYAGGLYGDEPPPGMPEIPGVRGAAEILGQLPQLNERARQGIPGYGGAADVAGRVFQEAGDVWPETALRMGDISNPLGPRFAQSWTDPEGARLARRAILAEPGRFTQFIREGAPRAAAGAIGDILHQRLTPPMFGGNPYGELSRPSTEQLAKWSTEQVNPLVEMAGEVSNPLYLAGPLADPKVAWEMARAGLAGAGRGITAAAPVARRLGQAGLDVAREMAPGLSVEDVSKSITLAKNLGNYPERESIVTRTLAGLQEKGTPALIIGDEVYTPGMKFKIVTDPQTGRTSLEQVHELSPAGFSRAVDSYLDTTGTHTSYNQAAKDMYDSIRAERAQQQAARAAEEELQQARNTALYQAEQEKRQQLEAQYAATKFPKATVEITLQDGSKQTISGPSIGGIITHKPIGPGNNQGYMLTHAESGMSLGLWFSTQTEAKVAAMRLGGVWDFSRPASAVNEQVRETVYPMLMTLKEKGAYGLTKEELAAATEATVEKAEPEIAPVSRVVEPSPEPTPRATALPTEQAPAVEVAPTKQPWEKTVNDVLAEIRQPGRSTSLKPNLYSMGTGILEEGATVHGIPMREVPGWERTLTEHHDSIERALTEGKPVPPEVLSDYPDLAAKYSKGKTPTVEAAISQAPESTVMKQPWEMTRREALATGYGVDIPKDEPRLEELYRLQDRKRQTEKELLERAGHMKKQGGMDLATRRSTIGAAMEYVPRTIEDAKRTPKAGIKPLREEHNSIIAEIENLTNALEADYAHSRLVERALSDGKPVPETVLRDYPDLARRSLVTPERSPEPPATLTATAAPEAIAQGDFIKDTQGNTGIVIGESTGKVPAWKVRDGNGNVDLVPKEDAELLAKTPPTEVKPVESVEAATPEVQAVLPEVSPEVKAVETPVATTEAPTVEAPKEVPAVAPPPYDKLRQQQQDYIAKLDGQVDQRKIQGYRVYQDKNGNTFLETVSNGDKSHFKRLKVDGTTNDIEKRGTGWQQIGENTRDIKRRPKQKVPTTGGAGEPPKPPRRPLWEGIEPPEEGPKPTGETGPTELPSGRKVPKLERMENEPVTPEWEPSGKEPGGEQNYVPTEPPDPYQQTVDALTPDKAPVRDRIKSAFNYLMRETNDRNFDLGTLEDATGIPAHKLAQIVAGSVAAGEDRVRRLVLPIIDRLPRGDVKHLEEYMVLKRNEDLLARNPQARLPGGVQGWNTLQAQKNLKAAVGADRYKALEEAAKDLYDVNRQLILKPLLDEGMMSAEQYRALTTAHPHYIDFHRADFSVTDEIERIVARPEGNVTSLNIKRMEKGGSVRKLDDPLARTEAQVVRTATLVSRNRAAKAIVEALETQKLARLLEPGERAETSVLTDTISFFKDGERVTYQVPPVYAKIAKGLEGETADAAHRFFATLGAPLRHGAVTYNPSFVVVNPIRDAVSAFFREGLVPMSPEYIKGWVAAITRNSNFTDAAEAGVLMSGIVENMRSTEALARAGSMGAIRVDNAKDALLLFPRLIRRANEASEQATRIATYIKLRGQGISELEAAIRSRDVTVDFAKSGNFMKLINQVLPFTNAGVQGAANTLRLFKDNPKQALLASGVLAFPSIASYMWNQRFETARMIPDYEYVNNWVFQFGEGTKNPDPRYPTAKAEKFPIYVKMPKGPLGAFITAPVEMAIRLAWAKDDRSVTEHFLGAAKTMAQAMSPFETNVSGALPPIASTAVGLAMNKDPFRNEEIVPQREKNRPAELQFGQETSKAAVAMGEQFHVSPRLIDFAIKDYAAGTGQLGLWMADLALGALGYKPEAPGQVMRQQPSEAETVSRTPIIGRFVGTKASAEDILGRDRFDQAVDESQRRFMALPETKRLGMSIGPVPPAITIDGNAVEMTWQQRANLMESATEGELAGLSTLTELDWYKKQTDEGKKKLIQQTMSEARKLAHDNIKETMPGGKREGQAPRLDTETIKKEMAEYPQALLEYAQLKTLPRRLGTTKQDEKVASYVTGEIAKYKASTNRPVTSEYALAQLKPKLGDKAIAIYRTVQRLPVNPNVDRFKREHPLVRKWFSGVDPTEFAEALPNVANQ